MATRKRATRLTYDNAFQAGTIPPLPAVVVDFFDIRPVGFEVSGGELKFLPGYHASGHISGEELINLIQEVKPEAVIPVHTEKPQLFAEKLGKDFNVILPKEGKPIKL